MTKGDLLAPSLRSDLAQAQVDRERICPVPAGVGWVEGDSLRLRLAEGTLAVRAPNRLLRRVLSLCDGERSLNSVVACVPEPQQAEFSSFLEFLFDEGALIDANHLTWRVAAFGRQSSALGSSAPEALTDRLRTRFEAQPDKGSVVARLPLEIAFSRRHTSVTFDDRSLEPEDLLSWLWSAAGIVEDEHPRAGADQPHRTVGSAGSLYLVSYFVVLLREVGPLAAGLYQIEYPAPRRVMLRPMAGDLGSIYRCFLKPWQLTFATGVLFAAADVRTAALRYRNRALPYLMMEVGASLQNLSLSAAELGVGCAIVGGFSEEHVAQLCGVPADQVLGSMVFGAPATSAQQRAIAKTLPIDFVWANTRDDLHPLPFHVARARLRGETSELFNTFGKDEDPRLAYVKAHAESVERQGAREPRDVCIARLHELEEVLHPASLLAYSDDQYAEPDFPYRPFNADAPNRWVEATDALTGRRVHVLADLVFTRSRMIDRWPVDTPPYGDMTSSGCAAGIHRDAAFTSALLELIERDAFMRHWLTQTPGKFVSEGLMSAKVLSRVQSLRRAGCEVRVQRMNAVAAHAVLVSATHPQRFFTCVAAAARFDLNDAVGAGLDELQTAVYTRLVGIEYPVQTPRQVRDPEGHTMLYAQRRYFRRADSVLHASSPLDMALARPHRPGLDALLSTLGDQGLRPCFVDVTPRQHCLDQGRTPISVVRALVPSLIPISFGHGREPRAMVPKVHHRSFFPHPFP